MTPTSPSPSPRGRLDRVPASVRHLWSLLYRATRRQAVRIDRLTAAVDALARASAHRSSNFDEMLGDALRACDEREGRVLSLRLRVDELERRESGLRLLVSELERRESKSREEPS